MAAEDRQIKAALERELDTRRPHIDRPSKCLTGTVSSSIPSDLELVHDVMLSLRRCLTL